MVTLGPRTTADEVAALYGQDLPQKTIIVTGANGGIGREAARVLVRHGARVILACRNLTAANEAVAAFKVEGSAGQAIAMKLDLSDFGSVHAFVQEFEATGWPLHILINNAGIMALPELTLSKEGTELQFQTNHLGHFLLANLLAPILIKSAPSRIVSVSSIAHRRSGIRFNDLNFSEGYDKWTAYGQAKTANILFAIHANKLLSSKGVEVFSLHPGGIMTDLQEHLPKEEQIAMGWITPEGVLHSMFKTIPQGASTHLVAALSPELKGHGGAYMEDCVITETTTPESKDPVAAKMLWALSEEKVGHQFAY
ncbi:oxidoreductase [Chytriomyces sp. MP71]|nr:oxidoreductase [Chytriomyces sp. MP71]